MAAVNVPSSRFSAIHRFVLSKRLSGLFTAFSFNRIISARWMKLMASPPPLPPRFHSLLKQIQCWLFIADWLESTGETVAVNRGSFQFGSNDNKKEKKNQVIDRVDGDEAAKLVSIVAINRVGKYWCGYDHLGFCWGTFFCAQRLTPLVL